jgi:hypothetical protein
LPPYGRGNLPYATRMARIVSYAFRRRKRVRKPQAVGEATPAILTSRKPGEVPRRSQADDDGPVSASVHEFYQRMLRPPGDG